MSNYIILQKMVVDRAGFDYSSHVNRKFWRTSQNTTTELRRVPERLANLSGPMRDCNLVTGPDHNEHRRLA